MKIKANWDASAEPAAEADVPNLPAHGNAGHSVVIDPKTRKVISIDGMPVKVHTREMQDYVDRHLGATGSDAVASPEPWPMTQDEGLKSRTED